MTRSIGALCIFFLSACRQGRDSSTCAIDVIKKVQLGREIEDGGFAERPAVSPLVGGGSYIVTVPFQSGELAARFDTAGHFLGRIGAEGEGPGEYRLPLNATPYRADSILLFDIGTRRISVLDKDGRFARSIPVSRSVLNILTMSDGSMIVSTTGYTRGMPLARYAATGKLLAEFGFDSPAVKPTPLDRWVGASQGDTVWVASFSVPAYHLERWDANGRKLGELNPVRAWFPPETERRNITPTAPPLPAIQSLWEDDNRRLWVLILVADSQWAQGLGPESPGEGGLKFYPLRDLDQVFDAMIEVLDSKTGEALYSRRFDTPLFHMGPGMGYSIEENSDGWKTATVYDIGLSPACEVPGSH
ncbi:MAG: hypothetical protein ABI836_11595 [Gemmatimonadota bacterium]